MSQLHVEERALRLLAVWHDWSIFPAAFLHGLQAMLHFSARDVQAIQELRLAGQRGEEGAEPWERLQKRARLLGVRSGGGSDGDGDGGAAELQYKVAYVERYLQRHGFGGPIGTGTAAAAAAAGEAGAVGQEDMGDIDGQVIDTDEMVPHNDDTSGEDIDGRPLEDDPAPAEEASAAAAASWAEDVDGLPFEEDLDGEPMDD